MIAPYTHAHHAAYCREMALQGVVAAGRRVQVKLRGITYCGRILEPWTTADGLDCWTIVATSPEQVRITVPCRQVRACDGGCICTPETPSAPVCTGALARRAEPAPRA